VAETDETGIDGNGDAEMSTDRETPQDFFETLNQEFHFTIDVAASSNNHKCKRYYSKNALDLDWSKEVCWMNPPYDKSIGLWLKKAYKTAQQGGCVVALIQGRSTDTIWWHDYVMQASEIRIIKDRLHFGNNWKFSRANISSVVVVFEPYCKGPPVLCSIDTKGNKWSRNDCR
jgi:site-specific DNA-methyltransferase (adenine-specific)